MIDLIPVPYEYKSCDGFFKISGELSAKSDFDVSVFGIKASDDALISITENKALDREQYKLSVKPDGILIEASAQSGAHYAIQSLRQISRYEYGGREIPCVEINDKPSYKWRGLQLDESRHFFGKDEVKRLLDFMFMMKLNVFHWHLTDDQGWRIEIKKYPLLTEIGSKRKYTHINGWHSREIKNEEYGGYYTQADIKEIVDYAEKRNIMVVPEIDFPAHSAAAIAAYPELACRTLEREVPGYFGETIPQRVLGIKDWNRTICLGSEKTMEFVFNVIDEVCGLFPAPYFHIGGDEAPVDEWVKCPRCRKVIKENNLASEENLQGWFNNRVLEFVRARGKRLIGWNEILKAENLDKSVIIQYWTPDRDKRAEEYVNSGGNMIVSKHQSFYFDMPYAKYPLKNTYCFSPEKYGINKETVKNIIGLEGECWSEWIDAREKLDMNLFPRMQALAEVCWSDGKNLDYNDFMQRLKGFKGYYNLLGINYAVDKISKPVNILNRFKIKLKFMKGDTHIEVKLNNKYHKKGDK